MTRFPPRVGLSTSEYGRDYRVGYGLGVLDRESLNVELGIDAQRRESSILGGTSNGVLGKVRPTSDIGDASSRSNISIVGPVGSMQTAVAYRPVGTR